MVGARGRARGATTTTTTSTTGKREGREEEGSAGWESHKIERSERQEGDTEWCRWQADRPPPRPPATASCRYYSPNAEYHSKFETARSRPNSYAESAVRFIQSSIVGAWRKTPTKLWRKGKINRPYCRRWWPCLVGNHSLWTYISDESALSR